ncbi:hypothetical protein J4558_26360 [Leptolyngbya sp. 15MV]|nr:hypothetical protein J4558_26360 [Leptolyngbya sp. 15MV]
MRLFVAIAPPEEMARRLREQINALPDLPPHRLAPIEQVHMTVQFIGEVTPRELPAVEEAVERSVVRRSHRGAGDPGS